MHEQDSAQEGSSVGCTINGIPPQNIFSQGGCNTVIHDCCQTEWEYHHPQQQLHSSTDRKQVAACPLVKRCMLHHLLGHLAVKKVSATPGSVSAGNESLDTEDEETKEEDAATTASTDSFSKKGDIAQKMERMTI